MKGIARVVAAAFLAGSMVVSQVWAANINSFIVAGPNQASDENREFLIDNVITNPGQVDVGDALRGIINFNTANSGGANLGGITGNDEFTGIFQTVVVSIGAPDIFGISPVILAPDPAFGAILAGLGVPTVGGEVIALFTDPSVDFCADLTDTGCAAETMPGFFNRATDGAFWATFGFEGAPGEGIAGSAPLDIDIASTLTSGTSAGNINIALSLISTGPGFGPGISITPNTPSPFGVGNLVDIAASQQLRGISDLQTLFQISTNTNVSFFNTPSTVVPEPSTLLLFGGGLLGLGLWARRRNKKA